MFKVFFKRFFILALFFSSGAFAQSYYWVAPKNSWPFTLPNGDKKVSSPDEACYYSSPNYPSSRAEYLSDDQYRCFIDGYGFVSSAMRYSCPAGEVFNSAINECQPEEPAEPQECEAGKETSVFKFVPNDTVISYPPTGCLAGCTFVYTSSTPCWYPHEKDGVLGSQCKITYTGTGEECSGGNDPDSPPEVPPDSEDEPDGPPNPDCKRFVNADGSWGYDCNPKPDPDENNNCPPGYMMQGDTCFRIPPDHPDYDEDKDPEKPSDGDGDKDPDGTGGTGGLEGVAQEKTLQDIGKTVKDIDASIKSGTASTNALLQGIKDAIGNIPGGGGGSGPGSGDGDGDGGGPELTAPQEGSFEEASVLENEEILALQDAIDAKFAEIKAFQLPGLTLSGGGGNLPVVSLNFGIFGSHQLDFNELQQPLIMMGHIFVFICGLLALFIMFVRT